MAENCCETSAPAAEIPDVERLALIREAFRLEWFRIPDRGVLRSSRNLKSAPIKNDPLPLAPIELNHEPRVISTSRIFKAGTLRLSPADGRDRPRRRRAPSTPQRSAK